MTVTGVSDEVWDRLDPTAARLPRATRFKVAAWSVAAVIITFGVLLLTASGLFIHRLTVVRMSQYGNGYNCQATMTIENNGWFTEHVLGQALDARGTGTTVARSVADDIPSGGSRTVRLRYPMTWCEQLSDSPGFLRPPATDLVLRLRRPWGTSTMTILLEPPPLTEGLTVHW
jgi:hypothetical protein